MNNSKQIQMKQNGLIMEPEKHKLKQQYDITVMSPEAIQDFNQRFNKFSKKKKQLYEKYSEMYFKDVVEIATYHTMFRIIGKYTKEEIGGLREMLIRKMENDGVITKCGEYWKLDLQELIVEAKTRYQTEIEKRTDMKRN